METDFTKFTLQQFYSVSSRYFQTFLFSFLKVPDGRRLWNFKVSSYPNMVGSPVAVGSVDSLKSFGQKMYGRDGPSAVLNVQHIRKKF